MTLPLASPAPEMMIEDNIPTVKMARMPLDGVYESKSLFLILTTMGKARVKGMFFVPVTITGMGKSFFLLDFVAC
jgi:hypothetical protein